MGLFPRRDPNANDGDGSRRRLREARQMKVNKRVNKNADQRPTEQIPPGPLQREGVWKPRGS